MRHVPSVHQSGRAGILRRLSVSPDVFCDGSYPLGPCARPAVQPHKHPMRARRWRSFP
jgi:hypothetical protein